MHVGKLVWNTACAVCEAHAYIYAIALFMYTWGKAKCFKVNFSTVQANNL